MDNIGIKLELILNGYGKDVDVDLFENIRDSRYSMFYHESLQCVISAGYKIDECTSYANFSENNKFGVTLNGYINVLDIDHKSFELRRNARELLQSLNIVIDLAQFSDNAIKFMIIRYQENGA